MAATRVFDLFNAYLGSTQVVGADSLRLTEGYRVQTANNDGGHGLAARDKTYYFAQAVLGCQEVEALPTVCAAFESADTLTLAAEGKLAGIPVSTKTLKVLMQRAKLVAASLSIRQGGYAVSSFELRASADPGSNGPEDEVTVSEVDSPAITHSSALRAVRVTGASFTPNGGSAITLQSPRGLDLAIRWAADQAAGGSDFGEVVETGGFEITGTLALQDVGLDANGRTPAQALLLADHGVLVVTYRPQASSSDKTITLKNVYFEGSDDSRTARRFGEQTLRFGVFAQLGADWYDFSGANKILTVA